MYSFPCVILKEFRIFVISVVHPISFLSCPFPHDLVCPRLSSLRIPLQTIDAIDKSTLSRDELFDFIDICMDQVAISRANSFESVANLREWRSLATAPCRWSWRWAAQAAAAAERKCLSLTDEADSLVKLMQVGLRGDRRDIDVNTAFRTLWGEPAFET